MTTLFQQTRALQFSVASLLVTAAITALPLLAADQYDEPYYAHQVVQAFQKLGAESVGIFSNGSLDTSAFDFASYFGHTCYRPTAFDMPRCKEKFGPYANLQETYNSGALKAILSQVSYLKDIASLLPGSYGPPPSSSSESSSASSVEPVATPSVSSTSSSSSSSSASELLDRTDRASEVWNLCLEKFVAREEAVKCYQRNIRLIMERREPVDGNLVY